MKHNLNAYDTGQNELFHPAPTIHIEVMLLY